MAAMIYTLLARIAMPICTLLIVAVIWTLTDTVMFFLAPSPEPSITETARQYQPPEKPPVDLERIREAYLFGRAMDTATPETHKTATVETRLPLILIGVFAGERIEESAAIIAHQGKSGQLYRSGDTLPGNASLVSVHAEHIVLARNGQYERLAFPEARQVIARIFDHDR